MIKSKQSTNFAIPIRVRCYLQTHIINKSQIITACQRSGEKVIFLYVSVRHSVHRGWGVSYDHDPWCIRPHCTGPWDSTPTPDMGIQGLPGPGPGSPWKWNPRLPQPWSSSPLVTSGDHHWGPVQTCSLQNPIPPPPILTSCGSWSRYGQHEQPVPAGMRSCF